MRFDDQVEPTMPFTGYEASRALLKITYAFLCVPVRS